jgi:TRAP-type C4-dicarboxylate transport system substrate-binding protein
MGTKMMLRLSFSIMALACAANGAQAAEKWDLPTGYPATNFHTLNIQEFGACVAKGTNGEINIAVHPNGVLFKAADIKRAVQTGQAVIGERLMSAHEKESAMFGTDSIPFLANTYEDSVKLYASARPELDKVLEGQGLKLLYSVPWPPQGLYFQKEVKAMADMGGIKIRSYNKATQRISELTGMVPVQIEAAETSQGLAAGVINALITSAVTGVDVKAWEQLKYFYMVRAWMPRNHIIINKAKYDGLDDNTKKVLGDCSAVAEAAGLEKSQAANDAALKKLAENGISVVEPSAQMKDDLAAVGKTMTDEWLKAAGDAGAAVLKGYKK